MNEGVPKMANYVDTELEIIAFNAEDVITTSCTTDNPCVGNFAG